MATAKKVQQQLLGMIQGIGFAVLGGFLAQIGDGGFDNRRSSARLR